MASHVDLAAANGISIYYCDLHSPLATRIREDGRTAAPIHAQEVRWAPHSTVPPSLPYPTKPQRPSPQRRSVI